MLQANSKVKDDFEDVNQLILFRVIYNRTVHIYNYVGNLYIPWQASKIYHIFRSRLPQKVSWLGQFWSAAKPWTFI